MSGGRDPEQLQPSKRLPALIPGVYHQRDARVALDGGTVGSPLPTSPLTALIGVLGARLDDLYAAITGLWDDHFVERAEAEALPLLGELYQARFVTADARVQRALLARLVGWRRRKGTLVTLEEVLSLTSGWDVEADEGFRSLLVTQDLHDPTPWRGRTAVLWDPIGLSDPLTRRSLGDRRPRTDERRVRGPLIEVLPGETVDDTVRRLGRVDAGRHAASPRTLDLRGWARPEAVVLRASRLVPVELEGLAATATTTIIPHGQRGYHLDPLRRAVPLVWLAPVDAADQMALLTARHEQPPPAPPARQAARLLTPTTLADDPDAVEASGALQVRVHGVALVGPPLPTVAAGPLPYAPVGDAPVLRFAEDQRPSPGDRWQIELIASVADADDPTIDDAVAITAELGPTGPITTATTLGTLAIAGRSVDLEITRLAGVARVRSAVGAWSDLDLGPSLDAAATSNAVALAIGADTWIVRCERDAVAGSNRLAGFVRGPGATWSELADLPAPLDLADGVALVGNGADVLAVVPTDAGLTLWSITSVDTTPVFTQLDGASPTRPQTRRSPQVALHAGRLYVHGGDVDGAAAGDVWSIAPAGGSWSAHAVRRQQERMGAQLLSTTFGLVLIGGDEVPGRLLATAYSWDPATGKAWRALPPLPIAADQPGLVLARADGGDLEVIAWADRTRPRRHALAAGASTWTSGAIEDGCAPPEAGEALFVGDELLVIAPAPLPASELLFVMGGQGYLAFLPRLDLPIDGVLRLRVGTDGGTYERTRRGPGAVARPQPLDSRFGGAFASAAAAEPGGAQRYSQPGRLARHPWRLAQRSLEPWNLLVAPPEEPAVLADPRLGRIVLPAGAPVGPVTTSTFVGRAGAIGVGCAPPDGVLPRAWTEPTPATAGELGVEPWPAIDDRAAPTAYLDPRRVGTTWPSGPGGVLIHADLPSAIGPAALGPPRIAVLGSATIPPARLTTGLEQGFELWAADPGTAPTFAVDPERGLSLALQVDETTTGGPPPAPRLALAGLWLPERLELIVESGRIDLRFCTLGQPGLVSVWMPGAGHQDADARWSIPEPEIELRLYGCTVGVLEIPPWVKLVAAGCTFDAGARDALAIRAPGARVRLRHCTVYGGVSAGRLEASSCVLAGEVTADRPDLGFVRHSLLARGGRPPTLHASRVHTASFISARPTDPGYLALAENNGPGPLRFGEDGSLPGAYAERGDHQRELDARTDDFLPIAMVPVHVDRTTHDLYRLDRR